MSWDSYIDNLIGHTNDSCDQACIIGLDGSLWTTSAHPQALVLTADEAATIANCMNTDDPSSFQVNGIRAGGVKYQFLRSDEGIVLGKSNGTGAITLQKSNTAIVIGHTKEGSSQGNVNMGVGVIAEYLASLGM